MILKKEKLKAVLKSLYHTVTPSYGLTDGIF